MPRSASDATLRRLATLLSATFDGTLLFVVSSECRPVPRAHPRPGASRRRNLRPPVPTSAPPHAPAPGRSLTRAHPPELHAHRRRSSHARRLAPAAAPRRLRHRPRADPHARQALRRPPLARRRTSRRCQAPSPHLPARPLNRRNAVSPRTLCMPHLLPTPGACRHRQAVPTRILSTPHLPHLSGGCAQRRRAGALRSDVAGSPPPPPGGGGVTPPSAPRSGSPGTPPPPATSRR